MIPYPTASHATRPRRVAPIIPAVPRSFERNAKEQPRHAPNGDLSPGPSATERRVIQAEDPSCESGQNLQIEISGELNGKDEGGDVDDSHLENHVIRKISFVSGELQHSRPFPEPPPSTAIELSSLPAREGVDENRGFKQPSLPHTEEGTPGATPTEIASGYTQGGVAHQAVSTVEGSENGSEGQHQLRAHTRISNTQLHALPDDVYSDAASKSSPTRSIYQHPRFSRHPSFHAPRPPPLDSSRYHTQASENTLKYQKSPSQYATTSASSNVGSSPTHSMHQGQTYGPRYDNPNRSPSRPRLQTQPDFDQMTFYGQPPPIPLMENEQLFMPSAPRLAHPAERRDSNGPLQPTFFAKHQQPAPLSVSDGLRRPDYYGPASTNEATALSIPPHFNNFQRGPSAIVQSELPSSSFGAPVTNLSLASHILTNFNVATFADCKLLTTHEYDRFPPTRFLLHSLLLAQSPRLKSLLANGHYSYDFDGLKLVHLHLYDRFITPIALEAALQVCYGAPVASFTGSNAKTQLPGTKADFSACWMKESLAFAAAGVLLQLDDIVLRGLEIAGKIINWENLEHAISFALEGARHQQHSPSASVVPNDLSRLSYDSDNSTNNTVLTPNTSQGSTDKSPDSKGPASKSPPIYGPSASSVSCADDLLFRCLQFLASHIPHSWEFDETARPLAHVDRLPVTVESRSPLAKSKLSKIQFGDLPTEMAAKVSDHDAFISSIILSIPFSALKPLVLMEGRVIKHHLRQIIEERERRRLIVLRSHTVSAAQREAAKHDRWIEVGYQEYVDIIDGDVNIARRLVGIHEEPVETATQK
ncbi:MAG: hypothetical protein Q9217_002352 [Psora testacea]